MQRESLSNRFHGSDDAADGWNRSHETNSDVYYACGGQGKIVVLTANAINGVREDLLSKGFDEYLEKPMDFNALEAILIKFLR